MLRRPLVALLTTLLFVASAPLDSFAESRAEHGTPTEQPHSGDHPNSAPCIGVCGCHAGCLIQSDVVWSEGAAPVEAPVPYPELTPRSISLEVTAPPPRR